MIRKTLQRPALLAAFAILVLALLAPTTARARSGDRDDTRPAASRAGADPPAGFRERVVRVNGITVNYVRGGRGPTLVLLHGYPQTWYEWRKVMPALAERFTVIAPDLRGAGGTSAPRGGYDKQTMAADLHGLLTRLGRDEDVNLVGHDIGTMVAYAYAAQHPDRVARLALTEAPIPDDSLYTFPALTPQGPGFWNFGFFAVENGLPERTVDGREAQWIERFTDHLMTRKGSIGRKAIREYALHLRDDRRLRASFEWFRAFPEDVADNRQTVQRPLTMPVLALGAQNSLGQAVPDQVRRYATDVQGEVLAGSGHWIFEERPRAMTRRLLSFLTRP